MINQKNQAFLISVIVPAYNAEKLLKRSIDSIISQTYKKIEIIIVDDGSKDNTGKIADLYAMQDKRVRVIHTNNGGEAKARNAGIAEAKGEFIAFCDADDYMNPGMLERMYNIAMTDRSDIVICSFNYVDENGEKLKWYKPQFKSCKLTSREAQKEFLISVNIEGFAWNKLIRKSLFVENDIQYDENRVSYCDVVAAYRLIESSMMISMLNEKLYDYYQIGTSCIHTPNVRKLLDYVVVLDQIFELALQEKLNDEGNIYRTYRLMKHLYGVYKERDLYDYKEMKKVYISLYEKYLNISVIRKMWMALKYRDEFVLKSIVKIILVDRYYNLISKE